MGIFRHKGSPYFQYSFTIKGAQYRGSTGLDSKQDARAWVAEERRKKILGIEDEKILTLSQGFAKYELEHLQFKISYKSILPKINHVLGHFGKDMMIHAIDQNEMEKYVAHCRTETYTRPKWKVSKVTKPATINRRVAAFQAMHTKCVTSWKVKAQPIDFDALMLKETTVINNTLAENAPQVLWDAAPPHVQHFIMASLCLGWRSTNVLQLNGKKQIVLDTPIPYAWTIGKGGKYIETPITDAFMHYIIANNLQEMKLVCDFWGNGVPVKSIKTAWKALFKRTKVKLIRIHDMRHTFGTWLYRYTRDQRAVQEGLAHSDINTSMRYTHTDNAMLRDQMNKMPVNIKQMNVIK